MIYADTDFFLALMKKSDWLKEPARRLLKQHKGQIWTSSITLIELLLVAEECEIDPERLLIDVMKICKVQDGESAKFIEAARLVRDERVGVFDSLHSAFCGKEERIISSDKVFDRLGLDRIPLEGFRKGGKKAASMRRTDDND